MRGITILILVLSSIATTCRAKDRQNDFNNFKNEHKKQYKDSQEHDKRFKIFSDHADRIEKHNEEAKSGKHSYTLKINKYADFTPEELAKLRGAKVPKNFAQNGVNLRVKRAVTVPSSKDWRTVGAVSAIRDQGSCGSCWAFSTAAVLESYNFFKAGKLYQLSEQNLVDCASDSNYCYGCDGGWPAGAVGYVQNNGNKINLRSYYPYTGQLGTCSYVSTNNGLLSTIVNVTTVKALDEIALKTVIGTIGPTITLVDAGHDDFWFYDQGVFSSTSCNNTWDSLNHAVNLVGYGTNSYGDYWILRNSWGTGWGMNGYMNITRGKNMCGLAQLNQYPYLKYP